MNLFQSMVKRAALALAMSLGATSVRAGEIMLETLKAAPSAVVSESAEPAAADLKVERAWDGPVCRSTLINADAVPRKVREVVLFSLELAYPAESPVYGEGFTMLSQTGGTLGAPTDLGYLTDRDHLKLPTVSGKRTAYNLFAVSPTPGKNLLFAFASCRRFGGEFRFDAKSLDIVMDLDGITVAPGARVELEDFVIFEAPTQGEALARLGDAIRERHPRLAYAPMPTGWCSWYCFGPAVGEKQILANLAEAKSKELPLKFIQIDDGYQPAMGDWLETGPAFGGGMRGVLKAIKDAEFEPAIWVAPFIAEKDSNLFKAHPDWFMKDERGEPLPSDKVTFGGWRRGPWYAVDGSNPEVQAHFEKLFRTMREEWGVKYFKLDALYWGAMPGGRLSDPNATRVEAYRRGMEAIQRGAGPDGFILGCNHPMWPSLGLIQGSRSSMDVTRGWENFKHIADETFHRNWQNERLWLNDPDCVLLYGKMTEDQFGYHATAILATGGMVLSGDNLPKISEPRLKTLRKLLANHPTAAAFDDAAMEVGRGKLNGADLITLFNRDDAPKTFEFALPAGAKARDFWTGELVNLDRAPNGRALLRDAPPTSARALMIE